MCRLIISAPPANCGAIRSTVGRFTRTPDMPGGLRACAAPWRCSIWIRLDHFRGFEAYYENSRGATLRPLNGVWVKGPGAALFEALENALGKLPIVAENLGVITPEVEALRTRFGFPGMAILQFAFGKDPQAPQFKPHNYPHHLAAYTGTHDNDTVVGWWTSAAGAGSIRTSEDVAEELDYARRYLNTDGDEINWVMIRTLLASVADTALFPLQDVLGVGSEGRMNLPRNLLRKLALALPPGGPDAGDGNAAEAVGGNLRTLARLVQESWRRTATNSSGARSFFSFYQELCYFAQCCSAIAKLLKGGVSGGDKVIRFFQGSVDAEQRGIRRLVVRCVLTRGHCPTAPMSASHPAHHRRSGRPAQCSGQSCTSFESASDSLPAYMPPVTTLAVSRAPVLER